MKMPKTKTLIVITAVVAVGVIVALKFLRRPARSIPASATSGNVPAVTNDPITEGAYNTDPTQHAPAVDDPNSLDDGVLTLQ